MSTVAKAIRELQVRRNRAQQELEKLSLAIEALNQLEGNAAAVGQAKPKWTMSAAARRKIAAFQRTRWAKLKGAAQPAKRKGKLSAAGRARIVAAQKARWAKIKAAKGK
jgi:hypothetical protein